MLTSFHTDASALQRKYDAAVEGLKRNFQPVAGYESRVLVEGDIYPGLWLESGPLNGLLASIAHPVMAMTNHDAFFALQRDDGYIPYSMKRVTFDRDLAETNVSEQAIGESQIQMAVPIAATAWEVATHRQDHAFLERAYRACSRWDDWLSRYRDTRATGLCELFCEFDTGHDHSPRTRGLPKRCHDNDARQCPPGHGLPWLAPDLSACVYGGRVALAKMAAALGRDDEAAMWQEKAERIRRAIFEHCFDADELCFYDRTVDGDFVRVRGDVLTRMLGEHVVDQALFDAIYERHIHNPASFWTPYPLPSIALDDPGFSEELMKVNAWAGGSQALTATRATRWFDHYGRSGDFAHMMRQWLAAMLKSETFAQQIDPRTGEMYEGSRYSPAMCTFLAYVQRLHGIRVDGPSNGAQEIEWNCAATGTSDPHRYTLRDGELNAALHSSGEGVRLELNAKPLCTVQGDCRVVTDRTGALRRLVSLAPQAVQVALTRNDGQRMEVTLPANATLELARESFR